MSLSAFAFRSPKRMVPARGTPRSDGDFRPLSLNNLLVWAGLAAASWAVVFGIVRLIGG